MLTATQFEFTSYTIHPETGSIDFSYRVIFADSTSKSFTETITLPAGSQINAVPEELLNRILQNIHLILAISYWKIYCPLQLFLPNYKLSKEEAAFWNTMYSKGLGEFYYRNNLDIRKSVQFPVTEGATSHSIPFERQNRSLVGIGGGKDSIVSAKLMQEHNLPFHGFKVENEGQKTTVDDILQKLEIEGVTVSRKLDPQLFTISDGFKGHIPISAIYAFLGLLTAAVLDYSYIVVSNENSADEGNTEYYGVTINHQWSKSTEFEKLFQLFVHTHITPNITYFSLLRPFSELKIIQLFTKYQEYFPLFSSCNRNFTIQEGPSAHTLKWCGECPKCAFAFIMLAAFLPKEEVISIFHKNLLEDEKLTVLYQELLGVKDIKPFDCVGTPDEVNAAFLLTNQRGEFNETVIMQMFVKSVLPNVPSLAQIEPKVFSKGNTSLIPVQFQTIIEKI